MLAMLLLALTLVVSEDNPLLTEARTGDIITITIHNSLPADKLHIYRKTRPASTPIWLGSIPVQPDVLEYKWSYTMPRSTVAEYRFFVVVERDGILEDESNPGRVRRIK